MPSEIEKTFGKTTEQVPSKCHHSSAILSLGKGKDSKGKGICLQCGKHVQTGTIEVFDPMHLQSNGTIKSYIKKVWL